MQAIKSATRNNSERTSNRIFINKLHSCQCKLSVLNNKVVSQCCEWVLEWPPTQKFEQLCFSRMGKIVGFIFVNPQMQTPSEAMHPEEVHFTKFGSWPFGLSFCTVLNAFFFGANDWESENGYYFHVYQCLVASGLRVNCAQNGAWSSEEPFFNSLCMLTEKNILYANWA